MILLQSTLFPHPDSPTIASTSPFFNEKETSLTAWTSPEGPSMLTERFLTSNKCSIFNPFSASVKRGHSACPRHNPYLVLFNSPVCNIPENTNSVMSHNGIRIDSLNIAVCNIVCINITDHRISRILCKSFLEISISFFTNLRISCLSCFCQIFVYFFVRVAGVVCSLICSEYFLCVVISI